MKRLVAILAKEMKVWPNFLGDEIGQAQDGTLHNEHGYVRWTSEKYTLCSDYLQDKVTRAEWQAAVDALNAPKAVQWDGEGDPPAMSKIEYKSVGGTWKRGVFVGRVYGKIVAGCDDTEAVGWLPSDEMRPIRTAEQVASEEIEAIREFLICEHRDGGLIGIAKALHESGYRKEPKPCGS